MPLRARWLAVVAVLVLPLTLSPSAAAGPLPADDPAGTVQLTPTTGGTEQTSVEPETGSADAVVYEQFAVAPEPPAQLIARTSAGATIPLGNVPKEAPSFWLVGNTLSATNNTPYGLTIDWWRLSDGSSGTLRVAGGDIYQSGAPEGFVYLRSERLFRRKISGATFDLGRPFVGEHPVAIADGQGMLAISGSRAKYLVFGHPGDFHTLDTGGHTLTCTSIASGYAACRDDELDPVLLPLDGRPAMVMSGVHQGVGQALSGSTLVAMNSLGRLYSEAYGSATVRRATTTPYDGTLNHFPRAPATASALGATVVADNPDHHVDAVSSATATPRQVVTAPLGPPIDQGFSLSAGQIAYSDDRAAPGVPPAGESSFLRLIATSAAHLTLGGESVIDDADAGGARASGTTTVYASTSDTSGNTLIVHSPRGTHTITGAVTLSVSGNRLVYATSDAPPVLTYHLYDAATGKTSDPQGNGPTIESSVVLDGDHLAYGAAQGAVEYEDLSTGATKTIRPPSDESCNDSSVYVAGDYVGWEATDYIPADEGCEETAGYRNVETNTAGQQIGSIVSMSASGPVIGDPGGEYTVVTESGDVSLVAGTDVSDTTPVVVSGRTVAWIDRAGALKVAPVAITPRAPRFLGDTMVLPPSGGTVLHDYAPYSEPLTSCSVAITDSGDQSVATLPCSAADTRIGVADFSWDGQENGSPAPAGTYTYTITAAGDGGPAQDADGGSGPVSGTFTIG